MKKKRNVLKRNSGFLVGCLLAAGVSYFTADAVMTKDLASLLLQPEEEETQQETGADTAETLAPEPAEDRVFETDPFTVTASGNVIKGVESEVPQQKQPESDGSEESETGDEDAAGNEDAAGDGETAADGEGAGSEENSDGIETGDGGASYDDGNSDTGDGIVVVGDGSSGDGYSENGDSGDGSYSDGSYEQPIEIQDAGNGSYFYDGGSGDGGSSDGGSYSDDGSAWTPSDVIIQGISSRYIGEEELYNYDAGQLRLIRNEIFALNGRIFESQDLRDYFSQKSWYVPTYDPEEFDANMFYYLNDYEEANLNVILNYEAALGGY